MSVVSWWTQDHRLLCSVWKPVLVLCCQKLSVSVSLEALCCCSPFCLGSILAITLSYRWQGFWAETNSTCSSSEAWACCVLHPLRSQFSCYLGNSHKVPYPLPHPMHMKEDVGGQKVGASSGSDSKQTRLCEKGFFLAPEKAPSLDSFCLFWREREIALHIVFYQGFIVLTILPSSWAPARMAFLQLTEPVAQVRARMVAGGSSLQYFCLLL